MKTYGGESEMLIDVWYMVVKIEMPIDVWSMVVRIIEMPIDVWSMVVNLKLPYMSDPWWWKLIMKIYGGESEMPIDVWSMVVNLKCS